MILTMRGTLLNTATVVAGATAGLLAGRGVPDSYQSIALSGLGLVTFGMGMKLFFKSRNVLVPAISVALGGVVGLALGIHSGIDAFASWSKSQMGGDVGKFNEGLLTAFVLFCIGPMTLLGCIQDALEKKIELLALKSTMDGIAAFFLAAAFGVGVLISAIPLLIFQGALTLLARPLRPFAEDSALIDETSAAGGAILMAIALGLLSIKDLHSANYLPALLLSPLVALGFRKIERKRPPSPSNSLA